MRDLRVRGGQLLDPVSRERCQVLGRPAQRRERRAALLVGERDGHVGATGERLEQGPLRCSEVFEPVGEHRLAAPRREVASETLDRGCPPTLPVGEPERLELGPVGAVQVGEVAADALGVDERALELADRLAERLGEPGGARRRREPVQGRACERTAESELLLRVRCQTARRRDALEQVLERPDRPAEDAAAARDELALDPVDVRPVRHDQRRLLVQRVEVALEEQRHLARVGRADQQAQTHSRPIVVSGPDGSVRASAQTAAKTEGGEFPPSKTYAAAVFGRRPRLAAGWPGILPAHASQRSACFEPRRASLKLIRITAPFDASISLLQLSQTSTVFRAKFSSLRAVEARPS